MRLSPIALPISLSALSTLVFAPALLLAPACQPQKAAPAPAATGELGQVVATVDSTVITVGDVQERINKQSPFIRARYTTLDKKKEFLDNLIRFEVMAAEAQRRGYDKDPEVIRVAKQQMISKFLQKDFESKLKVEDVPDADVEKYYKDHPEEFNRKDEVRVSQILVKDKAKADKVAAELKAQSKTTTSAAAAAPGADPQKGFRDLVTKYSEDEDSKQRAGDLTFFDKDSTTIPKPVVEAAFKLAEVGDVAGPIKSDKGYHLIKLTQKKPGFTRPLPEVKRQIQQRLFRDLRTKSLDAFVADMRKKTKIEVNEEKLAKVAIESGTGEMAGMSGAHGGMPGMPGMPSGPGAMPGMPSMAPPGAMPGMPGAHPPMTSSAPGAHPGPMEAKKP